MRDFFASGSGLLFRWPSRLCLSVVWLFPLLLPGQIEPEEYSWENPAFRERFTASYGVLSGVEPPMEADDRRFLQEQILPVISSDPAKARERVSERLGESASAPLFFLLGNLELELDNIDEARRNLSRAVGLYPDFRRAHRSLGILEFRDGDYPASIPHWQKVVRLGGGDDQSYGLLGFAYLDSEHWIAAARAFENALVYHPESRDLRKGLVSAYVQANRGKEASGIIRELLADDPDDPELWGLLANQSLLDEDLVGTAAALEAALQASKPTSERVLLLGNIYTTLGLPERALGAYQQLLNLPSADLSFEVAVEPLQLLLRQREWELANQYGSRIRQHFGRDLNATQTNELNAALLTARLSLQPTEELASTAESYAERFPTNSLLLLALGDFYQSQDLAPEAILAYRQAATSDEYRYEATLRLAQLLLAEERLDEAIREYRALQEIRYSPRIDKFLNELAQLAASR